MVDSPLMSVNEALNRILQKFQPLQWESVNLIDSVGRTLAEDILSPIFLPPFDNSGMDGFALHPADRPSDGKLPVDLQVVADIPAGTQPTLTLKPGEAARIMTGAPLPLGADSVVPVEDTNFPYRTSRELPDVIRVNVFPAPGSNIRPHGQDAAAGEVLLQAGVTIEPPAAALLASLGFVRVNVYRRPIIGILSTGDELIKPGLRLLPGKIFESNSTLISGMVYQAGAVPFSLGIAHDNPEAIKKKLDQAVEKKVDLIITSAGVSVGAFDFVRQVIEENGNLELWRVNMRPGKPLAFGHYRGLPLIGLPGNPVSAFTGLMVFVIPVIQRMLGSSTAWRVTQKACLSHAVRSDGRESYLRAEVSADSQGLSVHLNSHQGSANLLSIVRANALMVIPAGIKSLPAGSEVDVWLF